MATKRITLKADDGAFPVSDGESHAHQWGMSIREWYAGMALQGLAANPDFSTAVASQIAGIAFDLADAMIKENK